MNRMLAAQSGRVRCRSGNAYLSALIFAVGLVAVVLLSSCQREPQSTSYFKDLRRGVLDRPDWQVAEDMAICEAVFRYQYSNGECARLREYTFCLGFTEPSGEIDPPADFIDRFGGGERSVKACSECPPTSRVRLSISSFVRLDSNRVAVFASANIGPLDAYGGYYSLVRRSGSWEVVDFELVWIS